MHNLEWFVVIWPVHRLPCPALPCPVVLLSVCPILFFCSARTSYLLPLFEEEADALGMLLANCACTARGILETTLDVSRGLFLLGGGAEVSSAAFLPLPRPLPLPLPFVGVSAASFLSAAGSPAELLELEELDETTPLGSGETDGEPFFEALDPSSSSFLFSRFLLREALSGGRALNPLPKLQLFCLLMEHQSCPK